MQPHSTNPIHPSAGPAPEPASEPSRRGFLALGAGLAAAFAAGRDARAEDAPASAPASGGAIGAREEANLKVVNDFCAAWAEKSADRLGEFLAEDAVFQMKDDAPLAEGRETIVARFRIFLATAKTARFDVVRSAVMGDVVLNDRHDVFLMGTKEVDYHMTGVFLVKDGKIKAWLDYGFPKAAE